MAYTVATPNYPATGPANAAETACLSGPPSFDVTGVPSGDNTRIHGVINITPGASTTAVVVKVRRGTGVAGAQVGNTATHTLAAGASGSIPFDVTDFGAQFMSQVYSVTLTQTAGAGAGTINQASMTVEPTQ